MPLFYYLPKAHKNPTKPPDRPIIAGTRSLTSNFSQYIDQYLQKYVFNLDSYLKDTTSVINEVRNIKWLPEYKWATLDVAALYSNISHQKEISIVRQHLVLDDTMPKCQKQFILDGIRFI